MQKPNTVFAKKTATPTASTSHTAKGGDAKSAPAAHADKNDADKHATPASKK